MRAPLISKKLLVASIGVASVTYAACSKETVTPPGNLMPPQTVDTAQVGNLMPPQVVDASAQAPSGIDAAQAGDAAPPPILQRIPTIDPSHVVGNLMPMPFDAGPLPVKKKTPTGP